MDAYHHILLLLGRMRTNGSAGLPLIPVGKRVAVLHVKKPDAASSYIRARTFLLGQSG